MSVKYVKSCGRYGRTLTTTYREGEKEKKPSINQLVITFTAWTQVAHPPAHGDKGTEVSTEALIGFFI